MSTGLPKDVWVFKSPTEFKLVLSGSKRKVERDKAGNVTALPGGPSLSVAFKHGILVISDASAAAHGMEKDDLAALVKQERGFNRRYFLAQSPTMKLNKDEKEELAKKVEESRKNHGPKVVTGVRGRNTKTV